MSVYTCPPGTGGSVAYLCMRNDLRPTLPVIDGDALTFVPDLTAAEVATLDIYVKMVQSKIDRLTYDEFSALLPKLSEMRTLRTRTPAEWTAMTAAQRDNALIKWCQDITDVLRALLRD